MALSTGLLFISHPIQTEAVTYIWQRVASLATLFYLFSLIMYIRFRLWMAINRSAAADQENKSKAAPHYVTPIAFYLCSMLSAVLAMKTKEIALTLPVVITLYEFLFFEGKIARRVLAIAPVLITTAIIPFTFIEAHKPFGEIMRAVTAVAMPKGLAPAMGDYLFTQFRVIVTYIRLLFIPVNQNLDYDYPTYTSFAAPEVFLSFFILLSIAGLGVYLTYKSRVGSAVIRLIAFGVFWFFITLAVESSFLTLEDMVFEHRLYLPSIGAFIAITTSVVSLTERLKHRWKNIEKTVSALGAVAIVVFTGASYARNHVWENSITFWEDVVQKSPGKARPYLNLGSAKVGAGLTEDGIRMYETALKLNPVYDEAYNNLIVIYISKGQPEKALALYESSLRHNIGYVYENYYNLGNAYAGVGSLDKAIGLYMLALELKPGAADAHYALGIVYVKKGAIEKAIEHYQTAVGLKPDYSEAYNNLGNIYLGKELGVDRAIELFQSALTYNPDYFEAHNNIGVAYRTKGLFDKAFQHFNTAIKIKPTYTPAYYNIGVTYQEKGQARKADEYFAYAESLEKNIRQNSTQCKPDYKPRHN